MNFSEMLERLTEKKKDDIVDEVGMFWVVTEASKQSTIGDICFKTNVFNIMLQARGGLTPREIMMITKSEKKAKQLADDLIYQAKENL